MIGFVSILFTVVIILGLTYIIFKKVIRPKFPAQVTCWFCGIKTSVPYGKADSFDCPECDQYNGFNKDGDYNKSIPGQYDEVELAAPSPCRRDEFLGGGDVLCDRCSQNQLLKVKQLANFVPYDEKNYEWEATAFERHLERVYRICGDCEANVRRELEIQNEALARRLHDSDSWGSDRSFHELDDDEDDEDMIQDAMCVEDDQSRGRITISHLLHATSLTCAVGLLLCRLDGGRWPRSLPAHWSVLLHPMLTWLDRHGEALAWLGLMTAMTAKLLVGKHRLSLVDVLSGPVWLVVLLLQTGFIADVGASTSLAAGTANMLACLLCVVIKRGTRGRSNVNISRSRELGSSPLEGVNISLPPAQLDGLHAGEDTDLDEGASIATINRLTEVVVIDRSREFGSSPEGVSISLPPALLDGLHEGEDTDLDEDEAEAIQGEGESQPPARSSTGDVGSLTDQLSGLDSWIRRRTGRTQNETAYSQNIHPSRPTDQSDIRTTPQSSSTSQSNSRMSMSPSSKPRPLISPASFKYNSSPAKHKFGWGPQNFGLFSVTREPVQPFFPGKEISASLGPPPEKLAVSAVQSFGTSPYSKVSRKTVTADSLARQPVRSCEAETGKTPLESATLETGRYRESRLSENNILADCHTSLEQGRSTLDAGQTTIDRYWARLDVCRTATDRDRSDRQTRLYDRRSRQDQCISRLDAGQTSDQGRSRLDIGQTMLDAARTTNFCGHSRLDADQTTNDYGHTGQNVYQTSNDYGQSRLEEGQITFALGGTNLNENRTTLEGSQTNLNGSLTKLDGSQTKLDGTQAMECVEETVDDLVEQLFDLPTFTPGSKASTGLRRTDSGFFSCVSDCDSASVLGDQSIEQTGTQASLGPRPLVKSATFEYQSALPQQGSVDYSQLSNPSPVPSRGWRTLQESELHLLPTRDHLTGFGTAPYNSILQQNTAAHG